MNKEPKTMAELMSCEILPREGIEAIVLDTSEKAAKYGMKLAIQSTDASL